MPTAALGAWSTGPTHENVYCLDDPRFPQVSVTGFVAGKTGDADSMNGKEAPQYCRAMGRAVVWMHTQDTKWFDEGLGKAEEQTAVKAVDSPRDRVELLELGRYDTYGKYFLVFGLLEPNTLMGRLVVGHGDLKYDNTLIRENSTAENPQLVLIDYDRVMRLTAGCDLGTYLHDHYHDRGAQDGLGGGDHS